MPKLTTKHVKALKPRDRDYVVWDSEITGFGARVRPSGKITYIFKYRVGGGRTGTMRKPTIGVHGAITADQAREIVRDWAAQVAHGGDPGGQRKSDRRAPTMSDIADRYLTEHVDVHNKASTAREFRRLVERRVKPKLGGMRAAAVTRNDIAKLHGEMKDTPRSANQVLAVLSKLFSLCETWGVRPLHSNPCHGIKKYAAVQRDRFLSAEELGRLGRALREAEGGELPGAVAAIRLLAFTGCRAGEMIGLTWDRVDTERGVILLADAKAGARPVPLGAPALEVLAGVDLNSEWVCEAAPGVALTYNQLDRAWRHVRKAAMLDGVRLHDLRHTVGTYAGQAGFNAFVVRDILGHKTLAMTSQYVSRDTDPLRVAADAVSGRIAAAMKGEKAEIVELAKVKR